MWAIPQQFHEEQKLTLVTDSLIYPETEANISTFLLPPFHFTSDPQLIIFNQNLAIANISRVSCAHNTLRAYTVTLKSRL